MIVVSGNPLGSGLGSSQLSTHADLARRGKILGIADVGLHVLGTPHHAALGADHDFLLASQNLLPTPKPEATEAATPRLVIWVVLAGVVISACMR